MANHAQINLFGTVLQDPTNRQVNNSTVLSMRVAVQTTKKQQNSPYPASDIYDVAVWGKAGENLMGKVVAKSKVWISGEFMVGEPWKDRQGVEHQSLRVTASNVVVASGGTATGGNQSHPNQPAAQTDEEAPF